MERFLYALGVVIIAGGIAIGVSACRNTKDTMIKDVTIEQEMQTPSPALTDADELAEQARKIGTYKAEAREYYDEHERDFMYAMKSRVKLTEEAFVDEYTELRENGVEQEEAIKEIRNKYWTVTFFEDPSTQYCCTEEWAAYYENPTDIEDIGSFGYCEEVEAIGIAEKYNEETELKDVMYVITRENADGAQIYVVSSVSNFVEEKTEQMIERENALAEEEAQRAADEAAIDELLAKLNEDPSSWNDVPPELSDRTVPYKPGTITDYATGRTYKIGADVGDGYYGGGAYVGHDNEGNAYIVDKLGYEEYLQVIEDNKTAVRYPGDPDSQHLAGNPGMAPDF